MYVLILLAVIRGPDGQPQAITRPEVEYYQSEDACKSYGLKHVKEFFGSFDTEPLLMGGKCVKVTTLDGDPA